MEDEIQTQEGNIEKKLKPDNDGLLLSGILLAVALLAGWMGLAQSDL